jgi:CRISPR/Cas system-associated exonuclease Cas4 (RecB family)
MSEDRAFEQVDWSYSAAQRYETCQRSFYYQQKSFQEADYGRTREDSDQLATGTVPNGVLVGLAVHNVIGREVDRWQRGERLDLSAAQERGRILIEEHTENYGLLTSKNETSEEELKASLVSTVESHLATFSKSIWPKLSSHRYISHEVLDSFFVDCQRVVVRPDLCTRDQQGRLIVTDWKTRSSDPFAKLTLQLKVYGLWAHQNLEPDLTRIRVQHIFTSDGLAQPASVSEEDIHSVRERIRRDAQEWTEADSIAEFEPSPEFETCSNCPYVSKCSEGQNVM